MKKLVSLALVLFMLSCANSANDGNANTDTTNMPPDSNINSDTSNHINRADGQVYTDTSSADSSGPGKR